ncbi:MAG: ATP-binding protein [Firmicutes bacterium]|nr:ATP-binding protein [Bacillota bacterium]
MRDISLHLLDILQNSLTAKATKISIHVGALPSQDLLYLTVTDNGSGMEAELLRRVFDPFVTTRKTRPVGLGLPLLKEAAKRSGGDLIIESVKGRGTKLKATFGLSHIDRPPLGDIADTVVMVVTAHPDLDLAVCFSNQTASRELQLAEIRKHLGDIPLNHAEVLNWIKDYLTDSLKAIFGGVLDEVNC